MTDDDTGTPVSRRTVLGLLGAATGAAGLGNAALAPEDGQGSLTGGAMALSQAYKVADKLWIGPDSARSNVNAKSGRLFIATDTGTSYNGDSGSWNTINLGGGSGTSLTVEDDGSQLVSGADLLDFSGNDFDVTNPTGSEVTATIDDSGIDHSQTTGTRTHSGDDLTPDLLTTGDLSVGKSANVTGNSRPFITDSNVSVMVDAGGGQDYTTIQDAVNDIPLVVRHKYVINVANGTYNEDVVIPQIITGNVVPNASSLGPGDEFGLVSLNGDPTTPSNVVVDSITATGGAGENSPLIIGFEVADVNPYDNEETGIACYGCQPDIRDINFQDSGSSTDRGITLHGCYGGKVENTIDFGASNRDQGIVVKEASNMKIPATITGSVGSVIIEVFSGYASYNSSNLPSDTVNVRNGLLLDTNDMLFESPIAVEKQGIAQGTDEINGSDINGQASVSVSPTNSLTNNTTDKFVCDYFFGGNQDETTDYELVLNNDNSNGNYDYQTEGASSPTTGQDTLQLAAPSSGFSQSGGTVVITRYNSQPVISHEFRGRLARINQYTQSGTYDNNTSISNIELRGPAGPGIKASLEVRYIPGV